MPGIKITFKKGKKMNKKIRSTVSAALAIILLLLTFLVSCTGELPSEGEVTVLVEVSEGEYLTYPVTLSNIEDKSRGAVSILEYLGSLSENKLEYDIVNSTYGAYVNSIGPLVPVGNQYISVYTSVESEFSVPTADMPVVSSVVWEGVTLKYCRVGLSSMTVTDGTVILFRLESF